MPLRTIIVSIAVIYCIYVGLSLSGFEVDEASRRVIPMGLIALFVIAVLLHVIIVNSLRTWTSGIGSLASLAILFALFMRCLMKMTGDSL